MKYKILAAGLGLSLIANAYSVWRVIRIEDGFQTGRGTSIRSVEHDVSEMERDVAYIEQVVGIESYEEYEIGFKSGQIREQIKDIDERLRDAERKLLFQ